MAFNGGDVMTPAPLVGVWEWAAAGGGRSAFLGGPGLACRVYAAQVWAGRIEQPRWRGYL